MVVNSSFSKVMMTIWEKFGTFGAEVEPKGVDIGGRSFEVLIAGVELAGEVEVSMVSVDWPEPLHAVRASVNIKKNIIFFITYIG